MIVRIGTSSCPKPPGGPGFGGEFGELSTLNNHILSELQLPHEAKLKPFYSLVASISAEGLGPVELVAMASTWRRAVPPGPVRARV